MASVEAPGIPIIAGRSVAAVACGLCVVTALALGATRAGAEVAPPTPSPSPILAAAGSPVTVTLSLRPNLLVRCDGWLVVDDEDSGRPQQVEADFSILSNVGPTHESITLRRTIGQEPGAVADAVRELRGEALSRGLECVSSSGGDTATIRVTQR